MVRTDLAFIDVRDAGCGRDIVPPQTRSPTHANCGGCGSRWDLAQTAPVGLYDMVGNVWEWVEDCLHEDYSGAPADGSAWMTGDCSRHRLRGGSWASLSDEIRSANRGRSATADRRSASSASELVARSISRGPEVSLGIDEVCF
jgi:hypothetical protein